MEYSGGEQIIKNAEQFENTPEGWQRRWQVELSMARQMLDKFVQDGRRVVDAFLVRDELAQRPGASFLNLFTANVQTLRALLYGKTPKVDVKRRWGDPNDVAARTAGEMMQRLLNTDIERDSDTYCRALKYALSDRLLPGLGNARIRYVADFHEMKVDAKYKTDEAGEQIKDEEGNPIELAPAYTEEQKTHEDVVIDYVHWCDQLWSAGARTFEDVRWWAFRCPMTQDELVKRFASTLSGDPEEGKKLAMELPLNSIDNKRTDPNNAQKMAGEDPWQRADVWEIWDKENRKVWWVIDGYAKVLDDKPDPYELEGFFPFPEPLMANLTTDAFIPRADYIFAQDLYREINELTSRIHLLEKAVRMVGVYNGNSEEVRRMLSEAHINELIGVDDWRTFSEGGGVKGNIEWMPLDVLTQSLQILGQQREAKIALLYQVTGMSDIMRGESSQPATATEQAIKAKFASVRVQEFQEELARFASDLQRIRMELMLKMMDDDTLISRSNINFTADAQNVPAALQLLRDQFVSYRIEVKPESISATDYASMQQERTMVIQSITQMLQAAAPLGQAMPQLIPGLLEIMKWMFVGFRGGNTIEQVIDQMVQQATQQAAVMLQRQQNPPPDPKAETEKMKAGVEMAKGKMDMQQAQFDHAAKMQEMGAEVKKDQIETELSMRRLEGQMQRDAMASLNQSAPTGDKP